MPAQGEVPGEAHACANDKKRGGTKPARPKRVECIVHRVPCSEDGLQSFYWLSPHPPTPI
eukprot:7720694-Pyramimonas_sp.AAC.1